jgi:cytochrome c oxidase subunit 2
MKYRVPVFVPFLAAAAFVTMAAIAPAALRASDTAVTLTASNYQFAPAIIEAKVGVPVTLHITSSQGVHGVSSDELGIANTVLVPGKTVTVTFTPKKAGTYVVHCSVPCGPGHANMAFTVKVGA